MDNKEEILQALEEFGQKPPENVPVLLESYLERIAHTGETWFPWSKLKPLFIRKLDDTISEFFESVPTDSLEPCPNVENVQFAEMRQRLLKAVQSFTGAPFTIQRLCELVTNPRNHYKRTDKFMRGVEKNLLVVSTVDPFGNKIVSESKSLVNGLDSNGLEGKNSPEPSQMSPFLSPLAPSSNCTSASPITSMPGWFNTTSQLPNEPIPPAGSLAGFCGWGTGVGLEPDSPGQQGESSSGSGSEGDSSSDSSSSSSRDSLSSERVVENSKQEEESLGLHVENEPHTTPADSDPYCVNVQSSRVAAEGESDTVPSEGDVYSGESTAATPEGDLYNSESGTEGEREMIERETVGSSRSGGECSEGKAATQCDSVEMGQGDITDSKPHTSDLPESDLTSKEVKQESQKEPVSDITSIREESSQKLVCSEKVHVDPSIPDSLEHEDSQGFDTPVTSDKENESVKEPKPDHELGSVESMEDVCAESKGEAKEHLEGSRAHCSQQDMEMRQGSMDDQEAGPGSSCNVDDSQVTNKSISESLPAPCEQLGQSVAVSWSSTSLEKASTEESNTLPGSLSATSIQTAPMVNTVDEGSNPDTPQEQKNDGMQLQMAAAACEQQEDGQESHELTLESSEGDRTLDTSPSPEPMEAE